MGTPVISRADLKRGAVIVYRLGSGLFYGQIMHVGIGLAARNAVWIRQGEKVELVMIEQIVEIKKS